MLGVQEVGVRRKLVGPLGYGRWDLVGPLKKKTWWVRSKEKKSVSGQPSERTYQRADLPTKATQFIAIIT